MTEPRSLDPGLYELIVRQERGGEPFLGKVTTVRNAAAVQLIAAKVRRILLLNSRC